MSQLCVICGEDANHIGEGRPVCDYHSWMIENGVSIAKIEEDERIESELIDVKKKARALGYELAPPAPATAPAAGVGGGMYAELYRSGDFSVYYDPEYKQYIVASGGGDPLGGRPNLDAAKALADAHASESTDDSGYSELLDELHGRIKRLERELAIERSYTDALTKVMMPVYYMSEIGPMHDIKKLVNERKEKTGMQMIKDNMDGILEYIEEIEQALGAEEVYQVRDRRNAQASDGGNTLQAEYDNYAALCKEANIEPESFAMFKIHVKLEKGRK